MGAKQREARRQVNSGCRIPMAKKKLTSVAVRYLDIGVKFRLREAAAEKVA